ncbi:DUF2214 domain-containing protein [Paracoccus xiamenensis]|uniref:DUF2214 domain-containing protein n=1 Tax=Paracoccus xiamenensis TaxID=2714901 RepID=UPI00140C56AA|nr:DUF2214 domain-containing protein [Paracoccus xiamenensis]NHF73067.1 DUF2214 domain-containing protein [Paracoccus xiamenensis]
MRGSATFYALVNAAHILGIALILGAIIPLDLRLIGVLNGPSLNVIGPFLSHVAAVGVALAVLTGLALISVRPAEYLANPALRWKALLLALALVNVAAVHLGPGWRRAVRRDQVSGGLRLAAVVSICAWLGTLVAGRMIGFL